MADASDHRKAEEVAYAERVEIAAGQNTLPVESDLPPIVARMVVEIRSDGSRTVARGALEDLASGERVALRADGSTPIALATALAKSLIKTPLFAKQAVRALLQSKFSPAKRRQG
jgi:hypothetical protein